tara:strand:- start:146 stop:538 length:393 start_codon:yes stop_codon:yes gene_type:complete
MIEEDFYATVKLKTGEEIFAKVAASEEEDKTFLLLSNPITVCEVKNKIGIIGYKIEPWLKTTSEDMFVINKSDVLTMSESSNIEMIMMYQNFVKDSHQQKNIQSGINRRMGYLGNVSDTKKALEKIFKSS